MCPAKVNAGSIGCFFCSLLHDVKPSLSPTWVLSLTPHHHYPHHSHPQELCYSCSN
uniref:Uncharacterized protein n=1 Tax=Ciona intestinalis TaxID=7719 RepID=H2Y1U0_CIOIN